MRNNAPRCAFTPHRNTTYPPLPPLAAVSFVASFTYILATAGKPAWALYTERMAPAAWWARGKASALPRVFLDAGDARALWT